MIHDFIKKFIVCLIIILATLQGLLSQDFTPSYFAGGNKLLWVFVKPRLKNNLQAVTYSTKTKERLVKNGWTFDRSDYKLPGEIIDSVARVVDSIRVCSRLLRAISVEANYEQYLQLKTGSYVKRVEPVAIFKKEPDTLTGIQESFLAKNGQYGNSFTQLDQIGIPDLHAAGLTGKGVRIALLDAGFDKRHEVFQKILKENRLVATRDFVFNDNIVYNQNQWDIDNNQESHGTSVWSLIAAYNPGTMIGGAYNAEFVLAKTEKTGSETRIEEDNYIAGVEWADSLGADIISASLGYRDFENFEYSYSELDGHTARTSKAINWAARRGILCVVSAGNDHYRFSDGGIVSPADSPEALTVGAVDSMGVIAGFSSRGPTADGRIKPDLCAMGVYNFVANSWSNTTYSIGNGTSYSTPILASGCALLLENFSKWTPDTLIAELKKYATLSNNPDTAYGWGIPDLLMTYEKNQTLPEPPESTPENQILCTPNPVSNMARFYYHDADKIARNDGQLNVYNVLGQKIYTKRIKNYVPKWNLKDESGSRVPSGIYIIRIQSDDEKDKVGKMSIIF